MGGPGRPGAAAGGRREADLGFQKFQLLLHLAAFGGKFNTASPSKGAAVFSRSAHSAGPAPKIVSPSVLKCACLLGLWHAF